MNTQFIGRLSPEREQATVIATRRKSSLCTPYDKGKRWDIRFWSTSNLRSQRQSRGTPWERLQGYGTDVGFVFSSPK